MIDLDLNLTKIKEDKVLKYLEENNLDLMKLAYEQLQLIKQDKDILSLYEINELSANIYFYTLQDYIFNIYGYNEFFSRYNYIEFLRRSYKLLRDGIFDEKIKKDFSEIFSNTRSFFNDKKPYMFDGYYVIPNDEFAYSLIEDKDYIVTATENVFNCILNLIRNKYKPLLPLDVNPFFY